MRFYTACPLLIAAGLLLVASQAAAQAQPDASASTESSELSRLLAASGTLVRREYHHLSKVPTLKGPALECQAVVVENLLSQGPSDWTVSAGMNLAVQEKYSQRSGHLDPDEIEAFIATLDLIQSRGTELLEEEIVLPRPGDQVTRDLQYTSRDSLSIGAARVNGEIVVGVRVSSTADWVYLSTASASDLLICLQRARIVAREAAEFYR